MTPWTAACQAPLSMRFPRQNTGVGCPALLQGIFPTQESNPCLLCLLLWQVGSLLLCHLGSSLCYSSLWFLAWCFLCRKVYSCQAGSLAAQGWDACSWNWEFSCCCFLLLSAPCSMQACKILVSWTGIKPAAPAVETQSLNHWTTSDVQKIQLLITSQTTCSFVTLEI